MADTGIGQYLREQDNIEKAGTEACRQAAMKSGHTAEEADNCDSGSLDCKECPFSERLHICPSCRRALKHLNICIPAQHGTVELEVPEEDNALMNMNEVPEPIITCPECKEEIPDKVLDEWKVRIDEI